MVWFHMVPRKIPLTMSAAPAAMRQSMASHNDGAKPKPMIDTPQAAAASAMARPWWRTSRVQPLVRLASNEPTAGPV